MYKEGRGSRVGKPEPRVSLTNSILMWHVVRRNNQARGVVSLIATSVDGPFRPVLRRSANEVAIAQSSALAEATGSQVQHILYPSVGIHELV